MDNQFIQLDQCKTFPRHTCARKVITQFMFWLQQQCFSLYIREKRVALQSQFKFMRLGHKKRKKIIQNIFKWYFEVCAIEETTCKDNLIKNTTTEI